MAYTPTEWKDRVVQYPNRYKDQADTQYTFTRDEGTITEAGTQLLAETMNNIENALKVAFDNSAIYGECTGTANTYAVSLTPTLSAYYNGFPVCVKINVDCTGASTLNVDGLGAIPIKKANGTDFIYLKSGGIYTFRYYNGNFILQGEGGEYGTVTADKVLVGYTFGTEIGLQDGTCTNKKWANGNMSLPYDTTPITLTGLDFQPSKVIISLRYIETGIKGVIQTLVFSNSKEFYYDYTSSSRSSYGLKADDTDGGSSAHFANNTSTIITSDGFSFTLVSTPYIGYNINVYWWAFE